VSENREGFSFPVFLLDLRQQLLSPRRMAEEEHGGFREGPLQVDVAHLGAAGAGGLPGGLVRALDSPRVGGELLDAIESREVVNLREDGQRQDRADAGH
jgi:hypothetical protein